MPLQSRKTAETADGAATFSRRTLMLGIANAAVFGALTARLYDLQVLRGAEQAALAEDNRTRTLWQPAARGQIHDASGLPLAATRETFKVMLYPQRGLTPAEARRIAAYLAPRLDTRIEDLEARIVATIGWARTSPTTLADDLSFSDVAALQLGGLETGNVVIEPRWTRVYPPLPQGVSPAMAHIVGHVGAVDRFSIDDEPYLRLRTARIGKTGVEAAMEMELRGVAGRTVFEIDARGRHVRRLDERSARRGRDIELTIDAGLQRAVFEKLEVAAQAGAVVVLDVSTGAVRAMASTPSFDGAALHDTVPASRMQWHALKADPRKPLHARATAGQYPPGSTFKIVTALAALEAQAVTLKEKIECWGDVAYAGQTFRCWNRSGHIASDLHKGLRESCDCYFYEVARRTGIERIAATARDLGLGQTYEAGIAPRSAGLIPTPAWKRQRSRTGWLLGETILAGIGQGYVLTTPLQLAVMIARIASGRMVTPTLVGWPVGDPPPAFEPLQFAQSHLDALRRALVAVVNEPGGTGHAADPDDGKTTVAGKTGTSQVSRASANRDRSTALRPEQRDHAVFVAYAPAEAPRYAIAAVLEHAGGGGSAAAPLVREVVKLMLEHDAHRAVGTSAMPRRSAGAG